MTEKLKLRAYGDKSSSDVHERQNFYRREAYEENKEDIQEFRDSIDAGEHDIKCLDCYLMGLRFCPYWNQKGLCNEFEKGEIEKIFTEFK